MIIPYSHHWRTKNPALFAALLDEQAGECGICDTWISNVQCRTCPAQRPAVVDHDHDTGHVRGLLCPGCNIALGYLERKLRTAGLFINSDWEQSARRYLGAPPMAALDEDEMAA